MILTFLAAAKGIELDLTINIGHILTILAMIGGGLAFVGMVQRRLDAQSIRFDNMEKDMVQIAAETQNDVQKLTEVIITQTRHDERLTAIDQRVIAQGKRLDDNTRRLNIVLDNKLIHRFEAPTDEEMG